MHETVSRAFMTLQLKTPRSLRSWDLQSTVHGARQQIYGLVRWPSVIAPLKRVSPINRHSHMLVMVHLRRRQAYTHQG